MVEENIPNSQRENHKLQQKILQNEEETEQD